MELRLQNDSHMGSPHSTTLSTVRLRYFGLLGHANSYVVFDASSYLPAVFFCDLKNMSSELAACKLTSTR